MMFILGTSPVVAKMTSSGSKGTHSVGIDTVPSFLTMVTFENFSVNSNLRVMKKGYVNKGSL